MRQPYSDLYVLFRHNAEARQYFDHLPAHIQARIRALYRQIDSMDQLERFAARFHAPAWPGEGGDPVPDLPGPAQP